MKINALNLGFASAITTAIVWVLCSLLVWTIPGPTMEATGSMVHMNMSKLGWILSPMGFFIGLIIWSLFAGIFAWLLATNYNLFTKS